MPFAEDIAGTFFRESEFGTAATWNGQSAVVMLDAPTEDVLGGRGLSEEYQAQIPTADWPGISNGARVTIGGIDYVVREVRQLDDGKVKQLLLTKV